jgi:hypothetical protein
MRALTKDDTMWKIGLSAVLLAASAMAGPTQYSTVVEAIEVDGEYSVDAGNLVIVNEDPLHVMIQPAAVPGDFPEVLADITKREIVWTALQSFAHTSVTELTITAVPKEMNYQTTKTRLLTQYKCTVAVERDRFDGLIAKYLKLGTAADLIGDMKLGDEIVPNMLLDDSNRILYNDEGYPGLDRFYAELTR